jgi:LexA-binding, inner membrane-associated putative hydrolase
MATPIGHYLFGLSITQTFARDEHEKRQAFWLAAVACLPDLDIVPGVMVGKLNQFHHGASHSFFAAALFPSSVSGFFGGGEEKSPVGCFCCLSFSTLRTSCSIT